jgi:hypothetical protein
VHPSYSQSHWWWIFDGGGVHTLDAGKNKGHWGGSLGFLANGSRCPLSRSSIPVPFKSQPTPHRETNRATVNTPSCKSQPTGYRIFSFFFLPVFEGPQIIMVRRRVSSAWRFLARETY